MSSDTKEHVSRKAIKNDSRLKKEKASLRGVFHQHAAVAAATAGTLLVIHSSSETARFAAALYAFSLTAMLTISAIYHRPTWSPVARARMRRLDHAGIYLIIAGTYTPLCMLAMEDGVAQRILKLVWSGAGLGICHSLLAPTEGFAQKTLSAALYVGLGWTILPYASHMVDALGKTNTYLLTAGGIVYSLGAVVYAVKWPNPAPVTFGYHEVFHTAVIIAAFLHFIVVHSVVT